MSRSRRHAYQNLLRDVSFFVLVFYDIDLISNNVSHTVSTEHRYG